MFESPSPLFGVTWAAFACVELFFFFFFFWGGGGGRVCVGVGVLLSACGYRADILFLYI